MLTKNHMHNSDLKIEVSPFYSNGVASRSVSVLCEDLPDLEDASLDSYSPQLTYDTFQSLGNKQGQNCYTFSWDKAVEISQIIMTMGFPFTDGGWWTNLVLEYKKDRNDLWKTISQNQFSPIYNFMDTSFGRFPFERYKINFPKLKVAAIRLKGSGGGFSSFTSLSRIEFYLTENQQEEKIIGRNYPMPSLYRLISPDKIWELSTYLYKATGLYLITTHMQYYLNADSNKEFLSIYEPQYKTPPLWRLINDRDQWEHWSDIYESEEISTNNYFQDLFARIHGPILVEGKSLGSIMTYPPVLLEGTDLQEHKKLAEKFEIKWNIYEKKMSKMISMSSDKVNGIASLLGFIINEILNQIYLTRILLKRDMAKHIRKERLIDDALTIMEQELESGLSIDLILEKLHISYHDLSTAFKTSHGTTPNKIIFELKMERAKKYLRDDRLRIIDIAGTLGYTENHFIRSFKNKTGKTPGEFRKSIRHKK